MITITDGTGSESYSYDQLGRVTQRQKVISGNTYTIGYSYNLASELTSLTYPSGQVANQIFDGIGRLNQLTVAPPGQTASNFASGFQYNLAGEVTTYTYGNNVVANFGYTPERLMLSSIRYGIAGQADLMNLSYSYDQTYNANTVNDGQITQITDSVNNGRTVSYTYDALNRLSSAQTVGAPVSYPQWGLSWTYDQYGNRTAQTVTAGSAPANSLTIDPNTNRITGTNFTYDSNGNLTKEPVGASTNSYKYDAENRMVDFQSGSTTLGYDGGSLRVKKVSGGVTTAYIYSGSKVIAEYAGASLSKEYVYLGNQLLATVASGVVTYHHQDHLSIRLNTNSAGANIGVQAHFPFGEQWYPFSGSPLSKWQFTGYEHDSDSGNEYALMRYNSSRIGRFNSPDQLAGSISSPQTLNRYAYTGNDPVNMVDPLGLWSDPACAQLGGCGGGGGLDMSDVGYSRGIGAGPAFDGSDGFWGDGGPRGGGENGVRCGINPYCDSRGPAGQFYSPNAYGWQDPDHPNQIVGGQLLVWVPSDTVDVFDSSGNSGHSSDPAGYIAVDRANTGLSNGDVPVGMDIFHNSKQCPGCGDTWRRSGQVATGKFWAGWYGTSAIPYGLVTYGPPAAVALTGFALTNVPTILDVVEVFATPGPSIPSTIGGLVAAGVNTYNQWQTSHGR